jgi:hypothetical protein
MDELRVQTAPGRLRGIGQRTAKIRRQTKQKTVDLLGQDVRIMPDLLMKIKFLISQSLYLGSATRYRARSGGRSARP